MSNNTSDIDYDMLINTLESNAAYTSHIRALLLIVYSTVCVLGLALNSWVAVTACCVYQTRGKPAATVWVLGLAVTHLVCLAFLPFQVLYVWFHFNWHYEAVTCKFASYAFYFSFFSTSTMLSLWSISRCVKSIAGLNSAVRRPSADIAMALMSLTLAVMLALPSLFSRELRYTEQGQQCIDDFDFDDDRSTNEGEWKLMIVVLYRFLLGIALPALLMAISGCVRRKDPRNNGGGPLRWIMRWIKVAHFVCWTPLVFMSVLQYAQGHYDFFEFGLPAATALAAAHCCVNPVIYLLVRFDVKMTWMSTPNV